MTSKEINKTINKLEDSNFSMDCFADKPIFYWGWYWREVDFDDYPYALATDGNIVGFCESNKWGYKYLRVSVENSKKLRKLIETAIQSKAKEDFNELNTFMQQLK